MPSWFFTSLRGYRVAWLPRDLVAGLMLLAIALPGHSPLSDGMGTAWASIMPQIHSKGL